MVLIVRGLQIVNIVNQWLIARYNKKQEAKLEAEKVIAIAKAKEAEVMED